MICLYRRKMLLINSVFCPEKIYFSKVRMVSINIQYDTAYLKQMQFV